MTSSKITSNYAGQFGGGVAQVSAGSMDIQDTSFTSNAAGEGGGSLAVATASKTDRSGTREKGRRFQDRIFHAENVKQAHS